MTGWSGSCVGKEDMDADRCVCCGAIIPEGRQVCRICEIGCNYNKHEECLITGYRCMEEARVKCTITERKKNERSKGRCN